MVEGVQQGPVLVGTFFMVAEEYLPPTAAPGTLGRLVRRWFLGAAAGACAVGSCARRCPACFGVGWCQLRGAGMVRFYSAPSLHSGGEK